MSIKSKRHQIWSNGQTCDTLQPVPTTTALRVAWQQLTASLAALAVLAILLPSPAGYLEVLRGRGPGFATGAGASSTGETAMLLVAAIAVWVLLLWGSTVGIVALAGRLPGRAGRTGRVILARIAPGAARKLVLTAVGASMVTGLAACGAPPAAAAPGTGPYPGVPHDGLRSSISVSTKIPGSPSGPAGQRMSWTTVEGSAVQLRSDLLDPSAGTEAGPIGQMDIDWPTLPARPGSGPPTKPVDIDWPDPPSSVVVLAGDSLWSIAARHLPSDAGDARIEKAAQQWYAVNASVIGDNPDLILPGQILMPPNQEKAHRP